MSGATYFVQDCPICGRRLQVRIEHLGRTVVCQHCHGPFVARDPETDRFSASTASSSLLDRVDQLLASADERRNRPR